MDESLASQYARADVLRRTIDDGGAGGDRLQDQLQACLALYEQCRNLVERLALFSQNESIDDVASSELKYFLIDYYLAELTEKRFTTIEDRKTFLLQAQAYYKSFLSSLDAYSILPPDSKKGTTPADLRAAKIAEFKLQKTLGTTIAELESRFDDEDIRKWSLASIDLAVIQTRQNLASIDVELELLAQRPLPQNPKPEDPGSADNRLDRIPHSTLPKTGPLLSGVGKVLRPFVLTSKRAEIGSGVFRPDHSLPTMSVDDYLTEEIRRGGILGGEEEGPGNDRVKTGVEEEEEEDREMEKRREWDDYVESHAKGSGNMGFNRG